MEKPKPNNLATLPSMVLLDYLDKNNDSKILILSRDLSQIIEFHKALETSSFTNCYFVKLKEWFFDNPNPYPDKRPHLLGRGDYNIIHFDEILTKKIKFDLIFIDILELDEVEYSESLEKFQFDTLLFGIPGPNIFVGYEPQYIMSFCDFLRFNNLKSNGKLIVSTDYSIAGLEIRKDDPGFGSSVRCREGTFDQGFETWLFERLDSVIEISNLWPTGYFDHPSDSRIILTLDSKERNSLSSGGFHFQIDTSDFLTDIFRLYSSLRISKSWNADFYSWIFQAEWVQINSENLPQKSENLRNREILVDDIIFPSVFEKYPGDELLLNYLNQTEFKKLHSNKYLIGHPYIQNDIVSKMQDSLHGEYDEFLGIWRNPAIYFIRPSSEVRNKFYSNSLLNFIIQHVHFNNSESYYLGVDEFALEVHSLSDQKSLSNLMPDCIIFDVESVFNSSSSYRLIDFIEKILYIEKESKIYLQFSRDYWNSNINREGESCYLSEKDFDFLGDYIDALIFDSESYIVRLNSISTDQYKILDVEKTSLQRALLKEKNVNSFYQKSPLFGSSLFHNINKLLREEGIISNSKALTKTLNEETDIRDEKNKSVLDKLSSLDKKVDGIKSDTELIPRMKKDVEEIKDSLKTFLERISEKPKRFEKKDKDNDSNWEKNYEAIDEFEIPDKNNWNLEACVKQVKTWFKHWDVIEDASRNTMPRAEFIYLQFKDLDFDDYAPFILYYCRVLEYELLTKIFHAFQKSMKSKFPEKNKQKELIENDEKVSNKKGSNQKLVFDKIFSSSNIKLALGDMRRVLNNLPSKDGSSGSKNYRDLKCFQELHSFINCELNFTIDKKMLEDIQNLVENYRNPCAHDIENKFNKSKADEFFLKFKNLFNQLISNF